MSKYRFVGMKHPDELADGQALTFGQEVELSDEQLEANQRLIDEGLLIELEEEQPKKKTRSDK